MKKTLCILAVLATCCLIFADSAETTNLSSEVLNNFKSQALYVQTNEDTNVYTNLWNYSAHGYSNVIDFLFNGPSYIYTETKISWDAYQGTTKLTKDQFYSIAGYPELATKYLRFKRSRDTWTGISVGSLVAGLGLLAGGIYTDGPISDYLYVASVVSFTLCGVGLIILDVALDETEQFSVSVAMNAAQTYNVSLLATLSTN